MADSSENGPRPKGVLLREEINAVRISLGVRCQTCNYYSPYHQMCGLAVKSSPRPEDWCDQWDEVS